MSPLSSLQVRGERGFGLCQGDWPLSPELAVSCGAGHRGVGCTGLTAWLRTEEVIVTPFLEGRPACCRGRWLCCVEGGQDKSLESSITGNLEDSGIKILQWGSSHSHARSPHQVTDGATWAVLVGRCHGRARAFGNQGPACVVEAAAELLGGKEGRWQRVPGRLPWRDLVSTARPVRLAPGTEERTSIIRSQVVTTV